MALQEHHQHPPSYSHTDHHPALIRATLQSRGSSNHLNMLLCLNHMLRKVLNNTYINKNINNGSLAIFESILANRGGLHPTR